MLLRRPTNGQLTHSTHQSDLRGLYLSLLQGFRLRNSWESYVLSAPTSNSGNYSLIIYDRQAGCTYSISKHAQQCADIISSHDQQFLLHNGS